MAFSTAKKTLFSMGSGEYAGEDDLQVMVPLTAEPLWAPNTQQAPCGSGRGTGVVTGVPEGVAVADFNPLEGKSSIFVSRKFDIKEACWERNNKYNVCNVGEDGKPADPFMFVAEQSACFDRICCGNYRKTTLNIHNGLDQDAEVVLSLFKPQNLGMAFIPCLCRPEMQMTDKAGNELGKVVDPYACFNVTQTIIDKDGNPIAKIYGSICQIGSCVPCANVHFEIKDMEGNEIGKIEKVFNGLQDLCLSCNNFRIDFPEGSNAYFKAMLIGAAFDRLPIL